MWAAHFEFGDTEQGLEGLAFGDAAHVAHDLASGFAFVISVPVHDLYGDVLGSLSSEGVRKNNGRKIRNRSVELCAYSLN